MYAALNTAVSVGLHCFIMAVL